MQQKNTKLKSRPVKPAVVNVSIILVAAVAISLTLWFSHLNRLRTEMKDHFSNAVVHIEHGEYDLALTEAEDALALAQRLRDSDAADDINAYINLIQAVLVGNDFFVSGDYRIALQTYFLALELATEINARRAEIVDEKPLRTDLIDEKISTTEMYIAFYVLIENAEVMTESSEDEEYFAKLFFYETAISLYEEAKMIALALSFNDGIDQVESAIEDVLKRISEAMRAEAESLYVAGDNLYTDGQYAQSLEFFYSALDLYLELDDEQHIIMTRARIDYAENMLAEVEVIEPPAPDPQDGSGLEVEPTTNYTHNLGIDFDMRTLIDDQSRRPANQVRMGSTDGMNEGWYNGCGWVATYNALILLGNPQHPAEIVNYFETIGGTVFGGVFGTYPNSIVNYLSEMGYSVGHTLFPQITLNIDDAIKASRVSILAYAHTSAAHYVAVEYREDTGRFIVYNDGFARTRSANLGFRDDTTAGAVIDSVVAFISGTPDILFSFSLITVE